MIVFARSLDPCSPIIGYIPYIIIDTIVDKIDNNNNIKYPMMDFFIAIKCRI